MNNFLLIIFAFVTFLSIALAKLSVGLPVRSVVLIGFAGLLILLHKEYVKFFLRRHARIIMLFIAMSLLGAGLAFAQGKNGGLIFQFALKHSLQPFLVLMCSYVMLNLVGPKRFTSVFLLLVAITGGLAVLQFLKIDPAWQLRELFGRISNEPKATTLFVKLRSRPMGLSLTPIDYSYLIISAYVMIYLLLHSKLIKEFTYYVLVGNLMIFAIVNETRSMILGIALHEFIRQFRKKQFSSYLMIGIGATIAFGLYVYLEASGSRIVDTQDSSAVGRKVLLIFGWNLLMDNLLGFGWGFKPQEHAWLYWELFSNLGKSTAVFRLPLHNTFLNHTLVYGLFGIVPILTIVLTDIRKALLFIYVFTSFFVHGSFHNKGFFLGGSFIWIAMALFLYLYDAGLLQARKTGQRVQNWRYQSA